MDIKTLQTTARILRSLIAIISLALFQACASAPPTKSTPPSKRSSLDKVRRNSADAFSELDEPKRARPKRRKVKKKGSGKNAKQRVSNDLEPAVRKVKHRGGGALQAKGIGANESRAQSAGTAALSRIILSDLKSTLSDRAAERNGRLDSSVSELTTLKTNMTLKGVRFSKGTKAKGGIEVTATLDGDALAHTVEFLMAQTDTALELLTQNELDERLVKLTHLRALLTINLARGIVGYEAISSHVNDNYDRTLKFRESARIELRGVMPGDQVKIDGITLDNITHQNPIKQVSPGRHSIQVARVGFKSILKEIGVPKGRKKVVEFNLIPNTLSNKSIYIQIDPSADMIAESIPSAFRELGVSIKSKTASNAMRIRIELDRISTNSGPKALQSPSKFEMVLVIESFKGSKSVRTSRARESFFAHSKDGGAAGRRIARRLLRSLTSKLLPFLTEQSFFGGPKYNYSADPTFRTK